MCHYVPVKRFSVKFMQFFAFFWMFVLGMWFALSTAVGLRETFNPEKKGK
jgi:hypothetical protein